LTEAGGRIAEGKKTQRPTEWDAIERAAKKIEGAGNYNYMELSIAAKTHYILKDHEKAATAREVRQKALQLGWEMSDVNIEKAIEFLERIELVSKA